MRVRTRTLRGMYWTTSPWGPASRQVYHYLTITRLAPAWGDTTYYRNRGARDEGDRVFIKCRVTKAQGGMTKDADAVKNG